MLSGLESGIEPGPLNFWFIEELTEQSSRTQEQDVQKNAYSYFLQQIRNNPNAQKVGAKNREQLRRGGGQGSKIQDKNSKVNLIRNSLNKNKRLEIKKKTQG